MGSHGQLDNERNCHANNTRQRHHSDKPSKYGYSPLCKLIPWRLSLLFVLDLCRTPLSFQPPLSYTFIMADTTAAAQKKTKHGHAASQAQPTPRKVRFNVGMYFPYCPCNVDGRRIVCRHPVSSPRCRGRGRVWNCLLSDPSADWSQGRDKENHAFRPLNVLPADTTRTEAPQIPE